MSELLSNVIPNYGVVLERIVAFGIIFLGILMSSRILLYQLIYAFDPDAKSQRNRMRSRPVRVALAIADIMAWLFALTLTCLFFQIPQVMELLLSLFGVIWTVLPLTLVVLLIAYCFSRVGNELILSFIGYWYLQRRREDLDRCRYFDLGEAQMAEIEDIDLLATKFRFKEGGRTAFRPNAYLMQQFFGFRPGLGLEDVIDWMRSRSPKS